MIRSAKDLMDLSYLKLRSIFSFEVNTWATNLEVEVIGPLVFEILSIHLIFYIYLNIKDKTFSCKIINLFIIKIKKLFYIPIKNNKIIYNLY